MHPIYFPFTYIPGPVADVLTTWFDRITVLSPSKKEIDPTMQHFTSQGWLSIDTPFGGNDAILDEVVTSYREWAALHGGQQLKSFMVKEQFSPFYGDLSVYQLLDEIQSRIQGTGAVKHKSGKADLHMGMDFLKNRALLLIAQELDRRNWEIQQDLASVTSIERDFWEKLHATDGTVKSDSSYPVVWPEGEYLSYMLRERLEAWTCFLWQEKVSSSRIFVTTSERIVERFIQDLPSATPLVSIRGVPIHRRFNGNSVDTIAAKQREELAQWLVDQTMSAETNGLKTPWTFVRVQKGVPTTSLRVYRSQHGPLQWFCRAAEIDKPSESEHPMRPTGQATLLISVSKDNA